MYRKHFALTRHPFDKDVGQEDLFESESLKELSARLRHLLDLRGIGLVTGDSGSGKTTTCRRVVGCLHSGLHRVLYVSLTTGNVMDLYKTIAWEFGLPTERNRAALFKQIRCEVTRLCDENRQRPVLIIDEAHHLRTDTLEDVRLLTNYAMDSENRLTVVLVGHPELRRRLGMAALDALAQRIVVRANVRGLQREEIGPYLVHRLRLAGCELPLFEPATIEALFQASGGLPRKTNLLAYHALFAAALAKARTVTTEHVQLALQEAAYLPRPLALRRRRFRQAYIHRDRSNSSLRRAPLAVSLSRRRPTRPGGHTMRNRRAPQNQALLLLTKSCIAKRDIDPVPSRRGLRKSR